MFRVSSMAGGICWNSEEQQQAPSGGDIERIARRWQTYLKLCLSTLMLSPLAPHHEDACLNIGSLQH